MFLALPSVYNFSKDIMVDDEILEWIMEITIKKMKNASYFYVNMW